MLSSLSTALKTLRRSSSPATAASGDDRDLVALINESRTDADRRRVAQMASMRRGRVY